MTVARLLAPRWDAARNVVRAHPGRTVGLALAVAGFWVGSLVVATRVLDYFQTVGEFGPLLTQRLLVLVFAVFLGILVLSSLVTALQTFFLASDVGILLASPVPIRTVHHARFVETLVASSWMVVIFGGPIFLAYGRVWHAGPAFYLALPAVLASFVVIPAAAGVLGATALVLLFPARGARDALLVGTGLLLAAAVLLVRVLDPERLAHPSGLAGFAGFLAGFGATGSPYWPTTWAAEVLLPLLGARAGEPGFHLALLAATAALGVCASATVVERLYRRAWSRAQVGRVRAGSAERPLGRWLGRLTAPLPRVPGLLLAKDVTVFLRDASQWSQLLLLGAVVLIYVYNFQALPIDGESVLAQQMRDLAIVLNLGLGGFVTTAVAVRFVFPMVSLEGRAWWVLRTAPVGLARVWWGKFWIGFTPLVVFATALVVTTNRLLGVPPGPCALFAVLLVPLVAAIVSLGLACGAAYPKLDTQNAAQIATGFGAIVYMVAALALIAVVVGIAAWPMATLVRHARHGVALGHGPTALVAVGLALAATVALATFERARQTALRTLARLGD